MLNFLALALDNDWIYIGIITILVIIIILTIISIRNDSKKSVKKNKPVIEPAKTEEEKENARLEIEKVVNEMQKNLNSRGNKTYEDEYEEDAIISYKELVKTVKNEGLEPHREVGMEVADDKVIANIEKIEQDDIPSIEDILSNMEEDIVIPKTEPKVEIKEEVIKEEPKPVIQEERKFRNTEFISPIYGRNPQSNIKKEEVTSNNSMDSIIDENFDEEDEFLDSLKGFRKNL